MLRDYTGSFRRIARVSVIAVAIGATPLAACGIKGPLKPAPPTQPAATPPAQQSSAPQPAAQPSAQQPSEPKP